MPAWDDGACGAPHPARITPNWPSVPPNTDILSLLSPLPRQVFPVRLNKIHSQTVWRRYSMRTQFLKTNGNQIIHSRTH